MATPRSKTSGAPIAQVIDKDTMLEETLFAIDVAHKSGNCLHHQKKLTTPDRDVFSACLVNLKERSKPDNSLIRGALTDNLAESWQSHARDTLKCSQVAVGFSLAYFGSTRKQNLEFLRKKHGNRCEVVHED